MPKFSWFGRIGKKGLDEAVNFTAGNTPPGPLDQNTVAFRVVAGIAVVAVGFMSWAILRNISNSAKLPAENSITNIGQVAALEKLKNQDTDQDGLNDYAELYTYHSSPYLWSSAGDNLSDSEKVNRGLDPNCPINKTCTTNNTTTTNTNTGTVTAAYLRQALKEAGVPSTTLDEASDDTLMNMYNQVVANSTDTNSTNTANIPASVSELKNLTANEIRQLMQQSGVDAKTLNQVDDATIKAIFLQAINSDTNSNTNS